MLWIIQSMPLVVSFLQLHAGICSSIPLLDSDKYDQVSTLLNSMRDIRSLGKCRPCSLGACVRVVRVPFVLRNRPAIRVLFSLTAMSLFCYSDIVANELDYPTYAASFEGFRIRFSRPSVVFPRSRLR